jgi:hypothetical protein
MIGRRYQAWGAIAVMALATAAPAHAAKRAADADAKRRKQEPYPPVGGPGGPPHGGGIDFLGVREAFEGKRVKGVPYQAQVVTEFVQTLGDGNHIVRRTTATVARDGEGRTRREHNIAAIGPMVAPDAHRIISIHDPVAEVSYMLNPDRHTARRIPMRRPGEEGGGPEGDRRGPRPPWDRRAGGASSPAPETESLGKQVIEGVDAEGTRYTTTIPADTFGNERPIQIVSERWYSPELQVVVMSRHRDPRFGETTYRLTGITRGEPDKSQFEVPADYKVEEGPPDRWFGFGGERKPPHEDEEDGSC